MEVDVKEAGMMVWVCFYFLAKKHVARKTGGKLQREEV